MNPLDIAGFIVMLPSTGGERVVSGDEGGRQAIIWETHLHYVESVNEQLEHRSWLVQSLASLEKTGEISYLNPKEQPPV